MENIDNLNSDYKSSSSHIIVGGCGRSGTTLLRVMLDSHPDIACGPESNLFLPATVGIGWLEKIYDIPMQFIERVRGDSKCRVQFIDGMAKAVCEMAEKTTWADKTPRNVRHLPWIFRHFPRSRFIHVIRDGRDVACSLRSHPRYAVNGVGELVETIKQSPVRRCAQRWVNDVSAGMEWRGDMRYYELRYESLVAQPKAVLEDVCDFLRVPFDDMMLDYAQYDHGDLTSFPQNANDVARPIYSTSVGRWRDDLDAEDLREFFAVPGARELMEKLNYADL